VLLDALERRPREQHRQRAELDDAARAAAHLQRADELAATPRSLRASAKISLFGTPAGR
jgi:hypothetical protein